MSYVSTIKADSPLHWWRMADGGGILIHDVGSSPLHGIGSTIGLGYTGPAANGGSISVFNPGGFTVRSAVPLTDPFSAEFWIWMTEDAPGAVYSVLSSDGVAGGVGYQLAVNTNRHLLAFVGASAAINGGTAISIQQWHHCALTHSATTVTLYLDGVADGTAAVGPIAAWNLHYGIGEKVNGGNPVNFAFISEAAHYNGTLAAANVAAHHAAAELITQPPIYTGGGALDLSSGESSTGLFPNLDLVLASVRKSYVAP